MTRQQPVLVVGAPEAESGLTLRDCQFPATGTGGAIKKRFAKIPADEILLTTCHRQEHRQTVAQGHKIGSVSYLQSPLFPEIISQLKFSNHLL